MKSSAKPDFNQFKIKGHDAQKGGLTQDPDYVALINHYQNAEFQLCHQALSKLELRYPGHPILIKIKDNLQMKMSVESLSAKMKTEEKRKSRNATRNLSVFAVFGTIIILVAFFLSYETIIKRVLATQTESESAQLTVLHDQAEQLLVIGQPETALEIIVRIMTIDPDYEHLPELRSRADTLLRMSEKYQTSLALIEEEKFDQALILLKEIEAEEPGLWGVSQQIATIEKSNQIKTSKEEGYAAFQAGNWDQVISAYETLFMLDPQTNDPQIKEQLLKGYLNKIISMLQNEDSTTEDIELAEQYYRKAVALIPQNKEFANERGNLQEVSSNLLEIKYTQTAKAILRDDAQTESSIAKAVSYLRKALNISPNNTALQKDLTNAEYYQVAFKDFIDMDWVPVISNLNQIVSGDANFANGKAGILLYEAYYALGQQYFSAGLYQDALINFEQAEILAWDDTENLMKLLQVQVALGTTLGKIKDFENAVSYYQFALDAIGVGPRLLNYPELAAEYNNANNLIVYGDIESSFIAFQGVIENLDVIYSTSEIDVSDGSCLAFVASENRSTIEKIIESNDLTNSMVITFGRELLVPYIDN